MGGALARAGDFRASAPVGALRAPDLGCPREVVFSGTGRVFTHPK